MSLWMVPAFFAACLAVVVSWFAWDVFHDRARGWLDDLDRAKQIREHEADDRERKLSVEPAGLGERILDESISECVYDHSGRGESDWTLSEIAAYAQAFDHLTYFEPATWQR